MLERAGEKGRRDEDASVISMVIHVIPNGVRNLDCSAMTQRNNEVKCGSFGAQPPRAIESAMIAVIPNGVRNLQRIAMISLTHGHTWKTLQRRRASA